MNNDLISRSTLKEKTKSFIDCDGFNPVWQIIDEAPTVDAISNDEGYEMYNKGYVQGYKRGKAEAIPHGKRAEGALLIIDRLYIEGHISNTEQGVLRRAILLPEKGGTT